MKRKPKFIWTEEREIIFYFTIFAIVCFIGFYLFTIYRNSYTYHNLSWLSKTTRTTGKLVKIEERKTIIQSRRSENLQLEYILYFEYKIDSQAFTNSQIIKQTLKNDVFVKKFLQKQLDSIVPIEYAIQYPQQSRIVLAEIIK
jgi:hypothetical protein